ncbi:Fic/DOC family protein [Corynebacterium cystitidis]|uniref:Fic/DOC family protein n=1 Tax=Corynebacterium cystitidis TaxID=35757 RepID=UPI00211E654D|nr:Fic family protein [Corynebacterium cystitidis]
MIVGDGWTHYYYPGTRLLKNKLGLRDPDELSRAEVALSAVRAATYRDKYRPTSFTFETMAHMHRWLFQDIYDWAGQVRTGPRTGVVVKEHDGKPQAYLPWSRLYTAVDYQFGMLADEHFLQHLGREELVGRLAFHWAEINLIHPFREGNRRTQLLFFSELLDRAGYELHLERLRFGNPEREEFIAARFEAMRTAESSRLESLLARLISAEDWE